MTGNGGDPATGLADVIALAMRESGTRPWMYTLITAWSLPTNGLQTLMVRAIEKCHDMILQTA
jgi:hypothetical protein